MKAALIAFLVASSAMGAQSEATSLPENEAYQFEKPMQCGKFLLPPSTCYPKLAFDKMNEEVKRLQARELDAIQAGDRRLTFLLSGFILGSVLGLLLGGYTAWLVLH